VPQGLGGGRGAARCRHGPKGGRRGGGGYGNDGCGLLREWGNHGGGVSLRNTEALGPGRQRAGGGLAAGAQDRQQHREEGVDPWMGFALAPAAQAPLDDLAAIRLQGRAQEEQPVFWRRQGAVVVDGKLAGRPGVPIAAPRRPVGLERRLTGWNELVQLVEGQAGAIQKLRPGETAHRHTVDGPWVVPPGTVS
jgi:hypothetical protein